MAYGVTQQMIDAYGEVIFKLSLNQQIRRGDFVRELNFEQINKQREGTGLTDEEIAQRVGLLPEQVGVVRAFVERKYHRIDLHRRLFHLGGGKRWKAEEYQHPAERLKVKKEGMELREALKFHPQRAAYYLENGYWANETMGCFLSEHAEKRPNAPAIITSEEIITWVQLKKTVDRLTNGLLSLGVGKSDVVAVQLPNVPEFLIAYNAISAVGGVMQAIHMTYREKDIEFLLNHSKARAIICLQNFKDFPTADVMLGIKLSSNYLKHVIVFGESEFEGAINFKDMFLEGKPTVGNPPVGSDPFLLLYTSGTTSSPKGVPLTYQNMLGHGRLCAPEYGIGADDKILTAAPLSHLYGLHSYHCSLSPGASTILMPTFAPDDMVKLVLQTKPTAIFMGPAHASAYMDTNLINKEDFSSLKYTVFSGAYSPPRVLRWWNEATGSGISQLWGMTELASGTFTRPEVDIEIALHSAGPSSPGNEVRVVSLEDGSQQLPNVEGELQVRGSSVFPGYLNNPAANSDAFVEEGWFRTGDLAEIDENGNLRITGRIKEIINRGGVKYNPTDIEELILTHPKVKMVAIVPMPDLKLGEKACCFIQLSSGTNMKLKDLVKFLDENKISKNKWPEKLEIIDEMPLTPTRKVKKGQLVTLLKDHDD